eukprot:GFUD01012666.1.p1 GENE.GFUD01012666.1~~GFUD01012666.1.p1  ORF type:complete len:282 (+),score=53.69 GFUD01012666.1:56-901(+)
MHSSDMGCLPTEILLNIFNNLHFVDLCNVVLVSKKWNSVGSDQSLWRLFTLTLHVDQVPELDQISSIPRLSQAAAVAINGRGEKTTHVRNMINDSHFCKVRNIKCLHSLRISHCNLSQVSLRLLSSTIDNISSLTLDRSYLTKLHYLHLMKDLSFRKHLTRLQITSPKYGLADLSPNILASAVTSVQEVTLRFTQIDHQQILAMLKQIVNCSNLHLKHLDIRDNNMYGIPQDLLQRVQKTLTKFEYNNYSYIYSPSWLHVNQQWRNHYLLGARQEEDTGYL